MRCLLASSTAAFLLAAALGCHHTAGVCDCGYDGCYGGAGPVTAVQPAPVKAEPIKALPKAGDPRPEE